MQHIVTYMPEVCVLASDLGFPEGPVYIPDGSIVFVEIRKGCLSRIDPAGTMSVVADTGGGPNGAAVGPDGCIYVCNNGGFVWHDHVGHMAEFNCATPWT